MDNQAITVIPGVHQLFLDDSGIAAIANLKRTMHRPIKKGAVISPEGPWEKVIQTRSAPAWDEQHQAYKLWLIPGMLPDSQDREFHGRAYAESKDGINWTKPSLGLREYGGTKENNLLGSIAPENALLHPDDHDPGRRYKGFMGDYREPIVSPDGIEWTKLDVAAIPSSDESNLSYDPLTHTFVGTFKVCGEYGRSHAIRTSNDFETWSDPLYIFHSDDQDQIMGRSNIEECFNDPHRHHPVFNVPDDYYVDVYNLAIFRYGNYYIGMPSMFHRTANVPKDWPGFDEMNLPDNVMKNVRLYGDWTGFHHVQLICSQDLVNWTRLGDRKPFLDLSLDDADTQDTQVIMPPSDVIVKEDELWLYYTGIRSYAYVTSFNPDSTGAVCLAVLRKDGFVSLDAGLQPGTIQTQLFLLEGSELFVNLQTTEGYLTIEVLSDDGSKVAVSQKLKGDRVSAKVEWNEGNLASHVGQSISLRFILTNGSLYSYTKGS